MHSAARFTALPQQKKEKEMINNYFFHSYSQQQNKKKRERHSRAVYFTAFLSFANHTHDIYTMWLYPQFLKISDVSLGPSRTYGVFRPNVKRILASCQMLEYDCRIVGLLGWLLLLALHPAGWISPSGAAPGLKQLPALPEADRCPVLSHRESVHLSPESGSFFVGVLKSVNYNCD